MHCRGIGPVVICWYPVCRHKPIFSMIALDDHQSLFRLLYCVEFHLYIPGNRVFTMQKIQYDEAYQCFPAVYRPVNTR